MIGKRLTSSRGLRWTIQSSTPSNRTTVAPLTALTTSQSFLITTLVCKSNRLSHLTQRIPRIWRESPINPNLASQTKKWCKLSKCLPKAVSTTQAKSWWHRRARLGKFTAYPTPLITITRPKWVMKWRFVRGFPLSPEVACLNRWIWPRAISKRREKAKRAHFLICRKTKLGVPPREGDLKIRQGGFRTILQGNSDMKASSKCS